MRGGAARGLWLLLALAVAMRLPFLNHPVQGDDPFYLAIAQHAQVDPLHPARFTMVASGGEVDLRWLPHPPGNAWILAALLALLGDVREVWFHAAYLLLSLVAMASAWMLARRFTADPLAAGLVFLATPAFVINGNSFETDLPFLAFFLAAAAAWVEALECDCRWAMLASVAAMTAAAWTSYQAMLLTPVLAFTAWRRPRRAWFLLALTPPVAFAALQAFEWWTTGSSPFLASSQVLTARGYQSAWNKVRNAVSLVTHVGWMVSPVVWWLASSRRAMAFAAAAGLVGAVVVDASPLFFVPFASGVLALTRIARGGPAFPRWWIAVFFTGALILFFAGSARYLLPIAAPLAFVACDAMRGRRALLLGATAAHLALGLALSISNYQHWNTYRRVLAARADSFADKRVWTNAEWGARFHAESLGAMPTRKGQALRPGDLLLTSSAAEQIAVNSGGGARVLLAEDVVRPGLPLRLFPRGSRSGYSTNEHGLRAFDITAAPIETLRLEAIVERAPTLSHLPMNSPEAEAHIVSGVYQVEEGGWRWMSGRGAFVLRAPAQPAFVEADFTLTEHAAGRTVSLLVDGAEVARAAYAAAGRYTLRSGVAVRAAGASASVTAVLDRPFKVPGDNRELGLILVSVGFRE